MRHIDPTFDMQNGIEPAPPPARNPNGTVVIPPQRPPLPDRPSLCRAGPCRYYHRFATQIDAANPRAVRLPIAPAYNHTRDDSPRTPCPECARPTSGPVYQPPAVFYVEVHHYCYPTTGVEMSLGALPVTECNRWDPDYREFAPTACVTDRQTRARRRELFYLTDAGRAFRGQLEDWERARAAEQEESVEAEQLLAEMNGVTQP